VASSRNLDHDGGIRKAFKPNGNCAALKRRQPDRTAVGLGGAIHDRSRCHIRARGQIMGRGKMHCAERQNYRQRTENARRYLKHRRLAHLSCDGDDLERRASGCGSEPLGDNAVGKTSFI
jgi:hypothetical protein